MLIRPCRLIDVDSMIDLGLGCIECLERIIYIIYYIYNILYIYYIIYIIYIYIHQDAVSTKFMLPSKCLFL